MRAFKDPKYDYYELQQDLGFNNSGKGRQGYILPKGAIFYHDKEDSVKGSIGEGCLKLCWTPEGNCYGWICGDCMAFHAEFRNTDLFKLVKQHELTKAEKLKEMISDLERQLKDAKEKLKELL